MSVKLEIPFQKLISIVEQLDDDERLILKKRLEKRTASTWGEKFGGALKKLGKRNARFSECEVAEDVKKAVSRVRAGAKN